MAITCSYVMTPFSLNRSYLSLSTFILPHQKLFSSSKAQGLHANVTGKLLHFPKESKVWVKMIYLEKKRMNFEGVVS
jgi:hypothetical protein